MASGHHETGANANPVMAPATRGRQMRIQRGTGRAYCAGAITGRSANRADSTNDVLVDTPSVRI